jgi:septal ring factor EnvC (AmiA/AmiB activator)
VPEGETEYERGFNQGKIRQELHDHSTQLKQINGSMGRVADRLGGLTHQMTVVVQGIARIDQAMTADKETVKQTAAALRDQADVAAARGEQRWTPMNRAIAFATALGGVVGTLYLFLH